MAVFCALTCVAVMAQEKKSGHALAGFKWVDYRLGDTVNGYMATKTARKVGWDHVERKAIPGSIAAEYLNRTHEPYRYDVLCEIVRVRGSRDVSLIPKSDLIVVHLRLGDTTDKLSETAIVKLWTQQKYTLLDHHREYVFGREFYEVALRHLTRKGRAVVIVGWNHHGSLRDTMKPSVRIERSNHTGSVMYRNLIVEWFKDQGFAVTHRWDNNPDDDFVYMSHASQFVYGGGGFSHMAGECVQRLGGVVQPKNAPFY